MQVGMIIASFILDEWLYSISWGVYHVPINIFIMLFLFKGVMGLRMIPAVFLSLFSNITAMVVFALFAMSVAHFVDIISYARTPQELYNPFAIAFGLGVIYATLQSLLFFIISCKYTFKLRFAITVAFLSNLLTALCVYSLPVG